MWNLSGGFDPKALAVVDGLGKFKRFGAHYSRRTRGAKGFTGVGREIVLLHRTGRAVWAVVYQKTPSAKGTGKGRPKDTRPRFVWRNMLFRNLYAGTASYLIRAAVGDTYRHWIRRYGSLPAEKLRTEIDPRKVKGTEPGLCYLRAGWTKGPLKGGKLHLYAPRPSVVFSTLDLR